MMFGHYRIGAKLPSDIVMPIEGQDFDEGENIINRGKWLHSIASKAPGKSRSLLKGANFVTGGKGFDWNDYFSKGTR